MSRESPLFATLTVHGVDEMLRVTAFRCEEAVSRPFTARVDFACETQGPAPHSALHSPATLTLHGRGAARRFHGMVAEWQHLGKGPRYHALCLEIRPRLTRLELRSDMRVFQGKTTPEILRDVLTAAGLGADEFRLQLARDYPVRDYCTQYRETDLDFFHRLLARDNLFYFDEHQADRHTLVIADDRGAHLPVPDIDPLRFGDGAGTFQSSIRRFTSVTRVRPPSISFHGYDPARPRALLQTLTGLANGGGGLNDLIDTRESGEGLLGTLGQSLAQGRLDALLVDAGGNDGESDCPALIPGHMLALGDSPATGGAGDQLLTRVVHEGKQAATVEVESNAPFTYRNHFSCAPNDVPTPGPPATARPTISGIQTALVVGPPGERIHTDERGRIKVQFHWDRGGERDERSSCWIRVAQPWAGDRHGIVCLPRIGSEVVVAFLDGDPDRPVVLGSLYNGENSPPQALPTDKTKIGIYTRSCPDDERRNAIVLEDLQGREKIHIHAGHDRDDTVAHDARTTVRGDQHTSVRGERRERVGEDHRTVDRDLRLAVGGDVHEQVQGSRTLSASTLVLAAANLLLSAHGVSITTDGAGGLTLAGAGGFITINADGIYLQGKRIYLNSGGAPISPPATPPPAVPNLPDDANEP